MIKRNHFIYLLPLLFLICVMLTSTSCSTLGSKKVLILGNSIISVNNLPEIFSNITQSMGKKVIIKSSTMEGARVINHTNQLKISNLLSSDSWTTVIINPQTYEVMREDWRNTYFYPAMDELIEMMGDRSDNLALFLLWGHREPNAYIPYDNYEEMQTVIDKISREYASTNSIGLVPVGSAWRKVIEDNTRISLYRDSVHPAYSGSYLSACVIYSWLYNESTEGCSFNGDLQLDEAHYLQKIAWKTVLEERNKE
ncbi:MAG: hypothetical protein KAQ93_09605 [Spirochaetales bacterium]|nr:hypothetical protein [Spirochaetales bacterium]